MSAAVILTCDACGARVRTAAFSMAMLPGAVRSPLTPWWEPDTFEAVSEAERAKWRHGEFRDYCSEACQAAGPRVDETFTPTRARPSAARA